jgi:valyl-tRNA synthetase
MRFHPQRWAKVYDHWLANIQDWCISRQLWWGHRIPVWYRKAGGGARENGPEAASAVESHAPALEVWCDVNPPADPENWDQDPDVLDTWFSSWLWPFATMGWPEQTATLKKFYPTTDLVTGPDIIFFWVARMIMAGYEFMGDLPFHDVYFTGIIRDKQGRKMSKTLGNSPDPLVLIGNYGADALRFGTMRSAPLGQDVLFDQKDVELGRNFCNKLWNACRFRQMQHGDVQGEINPGLLTSDDKWILIKLDQAIREITAALSDYRFNEATSALYRFFWSEYCDWYVEASKATLSRPVDPINRETVETAPDSTIQGFKDSTARQANTLAVIDFVLSHTLRLFHPFLPFITEELWHGMGYAEDMPDNQGGKSILFAPWPKPFDNDEKAHYGLSPEAEQEVSARYSFIADIRNLRAEKGIPSNKRIRVVYRHVDRGLSDSDWGVVRQLAGVETVDFIPDYQPASGEPVVHPPFGGKLFMPLAGLIDTAAEKARLARELEKIEAEIARAEQKLANPNFTQKAPPEVLAEHKKRLAEWQTKRAHARSALDTLG